MATMYNFGVCPPDVCTPEDNKRMTHSMDLLKNNYPKLYTEMTKAMVGNLIADLFT